MTIEIKDQKEHELTQELLPWYINDTLTGREAETVLKHLTHCELCQQERDRLYQLQDLIKENDSSGSDYKPSFDGVMARINSAEENRRSVSEVDGFLAKRRFLNLGLAASVIAVFFAAGLWFANTETKGGGEFQTLTSEPIEAGQQRRMELGFSQSVAPTTLRQALISTGSTIVTGPDQDGFYLVQVVVPGQMSNSEFLNQIKTIEGITSARFVD